MLKQLFISFVFILVAQLGFSQITVDITEVTDSIQVESSKDYYMKVTNNSNATQNIKWVRTQNLLSGWRGIVCDANACYAPHTNTSSGITLAAGATTEYKYTVTANSVGTSTSKFVFSFASDASVSKTVNFTFHAATVVPISEIEIAQLRVYPNPTSDFIQLSRTEDIAKMEIYDIQGAKVRTFQVKNISDQFNISDLIKGIYWVRLLDKKNNGIVTKKISKN